MSRDRKIKAFIGRLLFAVLLGIMFSPLFTQQSLSGQKPNPEIEALKKRISTLENQLQTVENVEKVGLAAKLVDTNAKLREAEINEFTSKLRESNNEWLREWSYWFLGVIGFFALILLGVSYVFWYWLRSRTDQLIVDSVEKSLSGFKEAVEQLNVLKSQLGVLEKEHAASVLENFVHSYIGDELSHPEQIKALREEVLLQLFDDGTRWLAIRDKAAEVLAARKSTKLVSPALKLLNSVINSDFDSDRDWETIIDTRRYLIRLVRFVGRTYTEEAYQGLTKFLNRLLTEDPKHKDLFLIDTVLSLAHVNAELNVKNSVSILISSISHFESPAQTELRALALYFGRLDAPAGIKEILTEHVTGAMPEAEETCLELLQKHDPEFVKEWKIQRTTANTENEESS